MSITKATLGCVLLLVVILATGLWLAYPAQETSAAPFTDVSGAISVDTTWTLAGSPYVVVGDVTVEPDITLTIEPGVQVRFNQ